MTTRPTDIISAASVVAVALLLAACSAAGSSDAAASSSSPRSTAVTAPSPTTSTVVPTGRSVSVAITSSGFSPAAVSVAEGDAVRFTNQLGSSTRVHFLNLGPDGAAYSPSIAAGASWSYVAPGPRSILIEAEGATGRPGQIQVTFS